MTELYFKIQDDPYLKHLGINLDELKEGYSRCSVTVKEFMINFLGVPHGGLLFSLADAALSAASNSDYLPSVAINISGSFLAKVNLGDELISTATRVSTSAKLGLYRMEILHHEKLIATFNGTVYKSHR